MSDVAILVLAWLLLTASVLLWVHCSRQSKVLRSFRSSASIAARLLVVIVCIYSFFCLAIGFHIDGLLLCSPIIVLFVTLATLDSMPGHQGELAFAIWLMWLVPCLAIKQFILGFPDASTLFPEPEPHVPARQSDPVSLESNMGTVVAQLRPMGQVEISGKVYAAVSRESGRRRRNERTCLWYSW